MNKVKIALLGLGNVGTGVWKIINKNKDEIIRRSGYEIEISKILVKDPNKIRNVTIPKGIITTDINDILQDDEIKIVVELMGGINPAKEYMLKSIKNKKHVVTANKFAIATEGEELITAANKEGVILYYEASVGGGIPIIHGINESLTANKIQEIVGIINGTTNYILTKMSLENLSFEAALKEAQEKGYAEAEPSSDIDGYDAMYKLKILTSLAFSQNVNVNSIYREGITNIKSIDINYAKEFGYTIKLLAIVKEKNNLLELRVHPTMIPSTHPLANVNDSFNAIFIKGNAIGDLMLYGRGAGDLPTGSAVVSDIISILRNNNNLSVVTREVATDSNKGLKDMNDTECAYYIRISVKDIPGVLGEITTLLGKNQVSISSVIQKGKIDNNIPLVFITHKTKEGNINRSLSQIEELSNVYKIESLIRVENF